MRALQLLVLMVLSISVIAQDQWNMEKDKEGITVYTRKIDGAKLKEYKGIVTVNATMKEVETVLRDVEGWDRIMFKCTENTAKVLKEINNNEMYTYMEISSPWPAKDRDVITYYKFNPTSSDGSMLVEFWGKADFIPEKKGLVRVPEVEGYWKLTDAGNGKTKIVHQAFSKPGGSVPDGLANSAAVNAPYTTLEKLRAIVE